MFYPSLSLNNAVSFIAGVLFGLFDFFLILISLKKKTLFILKFVIIGIVLYAVVRWLNVFYFLGGYTISLFLFVLLKSIGR